MTKRQRLTPSSTERNIRDRIKAGWQVFEIYLDFNPVTHCRHEQWELMCREIEKLYTAIVPMSMLRATAPEDDWKRPIWFSGPAFAINDTELDVHHPVTANIMVFIHPEKRVDLALGVYVMVPAWHSEVDVICRFRCDQISERDALDSFDVLTSRFDEAFLLPTTVSELPVIRRMRRDEPVANEHTVIFPDGKNGWRLIDLSLP